MDALAMLDPEVMEVLQPEQEYTLLLEVMMADWLRCPWLPTFSWNCSMVLHVLKRDPALRDLEHVQVDGQGMAYLFFYGKQGQRGLKKETAENLQAHVAEAFPEWISCSAHFMATLLPLAEGWSRATAALGKHHPRSWTEKLDHPVLHGLLSESYSTPHLVGGAPPETVCSGLADDGDGHSL